MTDTEQQRYSYPEPGASPSYVPTLGTSSLRFGRALLFTLVGLRVALLVGVLVLLATGAANAPYWLKWVLFAIVWSVFGLYRWRAKRRETDSQEAAHG